MALIIKRGRKYDRPAFICDWCGKEITKTTVGDYEWIKDRGQSEGNRLFFTHRECRFAFEQANGGVPRWAAHELHVLSFFLYDQRSEDLHEEG